MELSLIIPAYNEEKHLPGLLDSVKAAIKESGLYPQEIEIIVGDNGSTDSTAKIAAQYGCAIAHVEKRMIAAARNGGALMAKGKILAFVDADSIIHPKTFAHILKSMNEPEVIGGATGLVFERSSMGINLTLWMVKPWLYLLGLNSGVVFCFAKDFRELGGYPEKDLVAEDIRFLLMLKKHGKKNGRRFRLLDGVRTITSTRKFDKYGDWHFFRVMPKLVLTKALFPKSFQKDVHSYWYKR